MNILNRRGFLGALAAGGAAARGMASRLWGQVTGSAAANSEQPAFRIESPNLTVELSRQGEIVGLTLGKKQIRWLVQGRTSLAGCRLEGTTQAEERKGGGVRFTRTLVGESGGVRKEVTLYESFFPTKDSVRWEMRLDGHGAAWSTAIETQLEFAGAARKKFWTAWGDPEPDDPTLMAEPWPAVFFKSLKWFEAPEGPKWGDPLVLTAFRDRTLYYGSVYYQYARASSYWYMPIFNDVFCIPLATVVDDENDAGVSLALAPDDVLLDMTMETTAAGGIKFSRLFRRISESGPVDYAMDLTAHESSWRGGLRWMTERYPEYFHPPLASAGELGGTAAYSTFEGDLDAEKFKRMALTVNWKMASDFPYIGMWMPPVPDGEKWTRLKPWSDEPKLFIGPFASVAQMAGYSRKMREAGFHILNYYNASEFGDHVKYPAPPYRRSPSDPDFWKDPNDFLYAHLSDAIVFQSEKAPPDSQWGAGYSAAPGPLGGNWSWGCIVLDCGEPSYQNFMLDQARKLIEKIPDSSGLCIDRLDPLRLYNFRRDDGVSWFDGPARSLITSWKDFSEKLGAVQHHAGQTLFVNNHVKRLDILRHVDGLYDEHADFGPSKNLNALLGIFKPTIGWAREEDKFKPDADTFMQRYLYLGTFPMAPFPQNDHSIQPSAEGDKIYTDYGPMFAAMRGRQWVLLPRVIQIDQSEARANLFKIPGGYVIPVTFGGSATNTALTLQGLPEILAGKKAKCEVIHPGDTEWAECAFRQKESTIALKVPLRRGCAMVRLLV
jgi:hypothetical protein